MGYAICDPPLISLPVGSLAHFRLRVLLIRFSFQRCDSTKRRALLDIPDGAERVARRVLFFADIVVYHYREHLSRTWGGSRC